MIMLLLGLVFLVLAVKCIKAGFRIFGSCFVVLLLLLLIL